jgi:hypothetical protein
VETFVFPTTIAGNSCVFFSYEGVEIRESRLLVVNIEWREKEKENQSKYHASPATNSTTAYRCIVIRDFA